MDIKETIKVEFEDYKAKHIFEPTFAHVQIEWDEDKEWEDVTIKLNTDIIEDEDDEITYYCNGIEDLLSLCGFNGNPADFVIIDFYSFTEKL